MWLAVALVSSGHSDLLVASAAKATEYMLKTAAASVAAFVDHVLNTLLLETGAFACGYFFCKNDSHAAAAAAALFGNFLFDSFSKCVSEFDLVSMVMLETGSVVFCCSVVYSGVNEKETLEKCCRHFWARGSKGSHLKRERFPVKFSTFWLRHRRQLVRSRLLAIRIVLIRRVSVFSSRVRIGTTLTVACPWDGVRLPDGWTSPSVSTRCSALRSSAGLNSLSPSLWLLRRENDFCEGGGWERSGTQGPRAHCCGRLAGLHGGCVGHVQREEGSTWGHHESHWYWES